MTNKRTKSDTFMFILGDDYSYTIRNDLKISRFSGKYWVYAVTRSNTKSAGITFKEV